MISIALYNLKGGVGKTAATVNLAYLAAESGKKTLIWDLDPQGAAGFYFGQDVQDKSGIRKLLNKDKPLKEQILETPFHNLSIIPAAFNNRHLDVTLGETKKAGKKLRKLLEEVAEDFDMIFLDCPPGIGNLSEAIFEAANVILVPVIPTTLSVRAFEMILDFFNGSDVSKEKLLCFFNMVDVRKNLHNEVMHTHLADPSFLRSYIPYLSAVEKMGEHLAPVVHFAPGSYASQCYRDLWLELKKNIS